MKKHIVGKQADMPVIFRRKEAALMNAAYEIGFSDPDDIWLQMDSAVKSGPTETKNVFMIPGATYIRQRDFMNVKQEYVDFLERLGAREKCVEVYPIDNPWYGGTMEEYKKRNGGHEYLEKIPVYLELVRDGYKVWTVNPQNGGAFLLTRKWTL